MLCDWASTHWVFLMSFYAQWFELWTITVQTVFTGNCFSFFILIFLPWSIWKRKQMEIVISKSMWNRHRQRYVYLSVIVTIYTVWTEKGVLTLFILNKLFWIINHLLFSDLQRGILGKSCIPSKLFKAKFSAINSLNCHLIFFSRVFDLDIDICNSVCKHGSSKSTKCNHFFFKFY